MTTTGMFMPLEKAMLKVYVCNTKWMSSNVDCFTGLHLAGVILSTTTAVSLALFSFTGGCARPPSISVPLPAPPFHPHTQRTPALQCAPRWLTPLPRTPTPSSVMACFFDRNPRSVALTAKPHGRIEVTAILFKLILSFAFINDSLPVRVRVAIVCTVSISLFFCYLLYLPFFKQHMNRLWTGFSAVSVPDGDGWVEV
jgi:hypothetical protein